MKYNQILAQVKMKFRELSKKDKIFPQDFDIETHSIWRNSLHRRSATVVKWNPPSPNWKKVNVDGSFDYNSDKAGIGGVLRNEFGIIEGFLSDSIHCKSPIEAETFAMLKSIELFVTRKNHI